METTIVNGMCYGPVVTISVGASPFTWINPEQVPVNVLFSGNAASTLQITTDGVTFNDSGMSSGIVRLNAGQGFKVTYPGANSPTIKYTPN